MLAKTYGQDDPGPPAHTFPSCYSGPGGRLARPAPLRGARRGSDGIPLETIGESNTFCKARQVAAERAVMRHWVGAGNGCIAWIRGET